MPEYTSMYAYWLNYPQGWQYPASCTNSKGAGGWAASVDQQGRQLPQAREALMVCRSFR